MVKAPNSAEKEPEIIDFEDDTDETEEAILSEMNASENDVTWTYSVYRITGASKNGAKEPFLFDGDASEIGGLKVRLRDECGTGTYRVRVNRNKTLYRRFDIAVERPSITTAAPASDLATVISAVNSANEKTQALLERLVEKQMTPQQNSFDPVKMTAEVAKMVAMFQGMMQPPQPQIISPSSPSPQAAMKEVMDLFMQGVEFAKTVAPSEHSTGMTGLVERLLESPLLAKIADGIQTPTVPAGNQPLNLPPPRQPAPRTQPAPARPIAPPAPLPQAPTGQASEAVPVAAPVESQEGESDNIGEVVPGIKPTAQEFMMAMQSNQQLQQQIGQAIQYLITRAERGADAEFYADWCLDNWPDELIDVMIEMPDLVSQLQLYVPAIAPHRTWFQRLIDSCRETINDDIRQADGGDNDAPARADTAIDTHGNTGG